MDRPMRGVNLGNWLVLEKWMAPGIFVGTDAEDESHLWPALDQITRRERAMVHRDTYITDRDFAWMSANGVEIVRLPVPYFTFGGFDPYPGCVDHIDRAFDWAERRGIRILVDLHTVPGSQNGFDNGGICGVCTFHLDRANVEVALDVLSGLAERYGRRPNLWGIEVLNEPVSREMWDLIDLPNRFRALDVDAGARSEPVPSTFLRTFYGEAYERIRRIAPDVPIVFHDGFRLPEWYGFFGAPDFRNVVVDTHQYLAQRAFAHGDTDLAGILAEIDHLGDLVREASSHVPILVGEWSLDPYSPAAATLTGTERRSYLQAVGRAELAAWEAAIGWCYWSYRLNVDSPERDIWDFLKAIETGLLPADLMADAES
jgi:glucan 1,3-beta-glucosidase